MTVSNAEAEPATAIDPLEHFPVPFFASVLGLSGLTLALHAVGLDGASIVARALTVLMFITLAGFYVAKVIRYPAAVLAEWRHPIKLAFFPAISISMLLIATTLMPMSEPLARVIWVIGAAVQAVLVLAVLSNWIGHRSFEPIHISPAWFIPAVGNVVAPIAGVGLGYVETSWLFFSAGILFWVVLLVLVMNRLIFHDPLPGKLVPTVAILLAPPAVAFLAWLQLNGGEIDHLARFLYAAALVFFGLTLTQMPKLRGQPFALSWWALSFPVAAFASATLHYGALIGSGGHVIFGQFLVALLTAIVGGLLIRTGLGVVRGEICRPE